MRRILGIAGLTAIVMCLAAAAAQAKAKETPVEYVYGSTEPGTLEYFEIYRAATLDPATILLLHENGAHWTSVRGYAERLQKAGFTVLAVEWHPVPEKYGSEVWGELTGEIKLAIAYVQDHATALGIDTSRLTMVGGSRGANLSLLTSAKTNAAVPGTIKAIASLSGDPDVEAQINRNRQLIEEGEPYDKKAVTKISKTFGCQKLLTNCDGQYIEDWSAHRLVEQEPAQSTAPAMLLMASTEEHTTADWEDQRPMAELLEAHGVEAAYDIPPKGHAFVYFGEVEPKIVEFLDAHDGG